jgi:AAA ATPase domain/Adenylate and Guanylate cyclase catalytic domain
VASRLQSAGLGGVTGAASGDRPSFCAIGIQPAAARHNQREQTNPLSIRIGLHVGEPIRDEDDYFGTSVVVAKRLCDCAQGGQIFASDLVRLLIGGRDGYDFRPMGDHGTARTKHGETLAPYQPFIQALRHYVASCPADERLLQVGTRRGILAKLVPELSRPDNRAVPDRRETRGEGERYALFDAVASLLRDAASSRPLILVLDDLHWADDSTLTLLGHVARAVGDAPLLILGTYRETEVPEGHPLSAALSELRRTRALTAVSLGGLDTDHVAVLIQERGAHLAEGVVHAVAHRTEGNPFFVEEVVRHIGSGFELALPESVKDLLLRRLRRLGAPWPRARSSDPSSSSRCSRGCWTPTPTSYSIWWSSRAQSACWSRPPT